MYTYTSNVNNSIFTRKIKKSKQSNMKQNKFSETTTELAFVGLLLLGMVLPLGVVSIPGENLLEKTSFPLQVCV